MAKLFLEHYESNTFNVSIPQCTDRTSEVVDTLEPPHITSEKDALKEAAKLYEKLIQRSASIDYVCQYTTMIRIDDPVQR